MEQTADQRRDILPIVYDVQSIPTIGSGGPTQVNRGGPGRQRPFMSSMFIWKKKNKKKIFFLVSATRRPWPARGASVGPSGGRGSLGGRGAGGAGGVGPAARQ